MWNKSEHDFGHVKKGTIQSTSFTYSGDKEVSEIEPLCNCVKAIYTEPTKILKVTWKIKQAPKKSYESNKVIMIIYKDGSVDDLKLKAYVNV